MANWFELGSKTRTKLWAIAIDNNWGLLTTVILFLSCIFHYNYFAVMFDYLWSFLVKKLICSIKWFLVKNTFCEVKYFNVKYFLWCEVFFWEKRFLIFGDHTFCYVKYLYFLCLGMFSVWALWGPILGLEPWEQSWLMSITG
jgi:hypothetical protein